MKRTDFDVVVVGGGHAGCEAAHAAWRLGCTVALITFRVDDLGVMSCNPAIGGLGKGHLVREIDALDGLMGVVADAAGIQFRLLNATKGPAVQGPRVQADRALYRDAMAAEFRQTSIAVIAGEVIDICPETDREPVIVRLANDVEVRSYAVVLTTGTFLSGVIRVGGSAHGGGRVAAPASDRLAARMRDLGLRTGRLKTGTPPRLRQQSVDWDSLAMQEGDAEPTMMSFLSDRPTARQVACAITQTTDKTMQIVERHIGLSAMYGGHIEGVGPRYCPSIEDKAIKFPDKRNHQVFLEPEGLTSDLIYPNGLSTSLPADVQESFIRSIPGLEAAEIVQVGYAIEYDFIDPRCLRRTLQLQSQPSLFLAGQINGTTGYEEAAAQGLVAGVNAALMVLGRDPWVMLRSEGYIGVLLEDLVTRGVTEPYRMFTSRAEFRLSLRADNADARLTPTGLRLGLVRGDRRMKYEEKAASIEILRDALLSHQMSGEGQIKCGARVRSDAPRRSAYDVLGLPGVVPREVVDHVGASHIAPPAILKRVAADALYDPYKSRQEREIASLARDETLLIPIELDYDRISGLSTELQSKLKTAQPESLGQASRIEGMTPAALVLLLAAIRRRLREAA